MSVTDCFIEVLYYAFSMKQKKAPDFSEACVIAKEGFEPPTPRV